MSSETEVQAELPDMPLSPEQEALETFAYAVIDTVRRDTSIVAGDRAVMVGIVRETLEDVLTEEAN